jgi:hypothetical protein
MIIGIQGVTNPKLLTFTNQESRTFPMAHLQGAGKKPSVLDHSQARKFLGESLIFLGRNRPQIYDRTW